MVMGLYNLLYGGRGGVSASIIWVVTSITGGSRVAVGIIHKVTPD
jgi:hypothetical protein